MQGQHKYGGRENMNRLKLAGYIILAIGVGIWLYLLVLSIIDTRSQYSIVNIQYAIVAIVLVVVSYFIKRYSKKVETKQTPS
jgi:membrane protein implicated in regulation of membrane protease activity